MASYPPYLARITHFTFDAVAGIESPSPSGVDAELDAILEVQNQQNLFIRRITQPDGRLKNLASAVAMALAGTDELTATAAQTSFVTGIDWDSAFTVSTVLVFRGTDRLVPSAVADDGTGFLEVTLAAQDVGAVIDIMAFSSGAGILTRLQDSTTGEGSGLIAIEDAGAYTTVVTVEEALQELYGHTQGASGKTWLEGVLVMSGYLAKTGGTMTGDITMSASKTIKGLRAAAANGEAVRYEQFIALQTTVTGITSVFMPKAGGTFTGPVSFGSQATTGVPTPTTSDGIASKGYVDTTLASFGGLPVGTVADYAAASVPTGWLPCDGAAVLRSAYPTLFSVIGTTWGVGDGVTTFNVPDFRGRVSIGSGTGAGLTARTLAATGGEETHVLTLTEAPAHTHDVTARDDNGGPLGLLYSNGGSPQIIADAALSEGLGSAHNNMQPFAVVTKIIKY